MLVAGMSTTILRCPAFQLQSLISEEAYVLFYEQEGTPRPNDLLFYFSAYFMFVNFILYLLIVFFYPHPYKNYKPKYANKQKN